LEGHVVSAATALSAAFFNHVADHHEVLSIWAEAATLSKQRQPTYIQEKSG